MNGEYKPNELDGSEQLSMFATPSLHHRLALGFTYEKADPGLVYSLLQQGRFLRLYVSYMEPGPEPGPDNTNGRRAIVRRLSLLFDSLQLTVMADSS